MMFQATFLGGPTHKRRAPRSPERWVTVRSVLMLEASTEERGSLDSTRRRHAIGIGALAAPPETHKNQQNGLEFNTRQAENQQR